MKQRVLWVCFRAPFLSRSVPVGQVTGQPDHACSQHSGFSPHRDDTAALGNRVRRQITATRQKRNLQATPQRAAGNSSEKPEVQVHIDTRSVSHLLETLHAVQIRKHKGHNYFQQILNLICHQRTA